MPTRGVKLGLMKAAYLYCLAHQVHWMVIGARNAALARQYKRLGFTDLAGGAMVPLAHAADLPHRVLAFDVVSAERNWFAVRHPLYEFMVRHYHPDIRPFAAGSGGSARRPQRRVRCTRRRRAAGTPRRRTTVRAR